MKTFKIFSTAALALMLAACSSEDTALNSTPAQDGQKVPFTATIAAPGSGAGTRTEYTEVTSGDAAGTINVAWKAGDEIALIHNGKADVVKVETVNTDGSATITGDITVGTDGEAVEVCYPAALWEWDEETSGAIRNATFVSNIIKQDGTLKYIQDNLDVRMGEGKLKLGGNKATLSANVSLKSQIAIWKLTMRDDAETPAALKATQVIVKVDEPTATIARTTTLSTPTSTVYLAMDMINEEYLTIEATVGEDTYSYTNEVTSLERGKYYQSTVTMAKAVATYREYSYTTSLTYKDVSIPSDAKTVSSSTTSWSGTYTVDGSVTINGDVNCTGDVNLILLDGSKLTVNGHIFGGDGLGTADTYSLSIYAQSEGSNMGALYIDAGNSGNNLVVKNLAIHGGKIVATNGGQALEAYGPFKIYGGDISATGSYQGIMATKGGLEIHGGTVVANGGTNGIQAYNCNVTITGGNVTANSTGTMAGLYVQGNLNISGNSVVKGTSASQMEGIQALPIYELEEPVADTGIITISGNPTVKAYGGPGGATGNLSGGIGLNGIQINISGGTITAVGGNGANGGSGGNGVVGAINITGGTLTATGGNGANGGVNGDGAGLNGGFGGNGVEGAINITGGTLTATGGNGGNGGNATGDNQPGGNGGNGGTGIMGVVTGSGADSAINAATGGTGGAGGTGKGTGAIGESGDEGAEHDEGLE